MSPGTFGVGPATLMSLPPRITNQLAPEDLARMSNPLGTIAEQAAPLYDRHADIVWWRGIKSKSEDEFVRALPDLRTRWNKQQSDKMIFFSKTTVSIRRKIYAFVYEHPPNGRHVNLSKDFTTKEVFPPDFFIAPWDLLIHAEGALSSCTQLRNEIFTYFWNTYHFHVTFSPYSIGPAFSGLSIRLLNAYAHRVNHLTVEVDMTKLAFSAAKDAKLLKQSNKKIQKVLVNLVISLRRRSQKGNVMASLTLLARRYAGFRPAPSHAPEEREVPFCPDNALYLFDVFCELKPLVLQCRMSGFSIWYTRQLLREILIPPFLTKPRPAPVIPAWPHYVPAAVEVVYLSNISSVVSPRIAPISISQKFPSRTTSDTTRSIDIPGFNSTIPSFGYSQASSSAGSLLPPNGQERGFYQLQGGSFEQLYDQSLLSAPNTPSIGSINACLEQPVNFQQSSSIAQTAREICVSRPNSVSMASSGSLTSPRGMASPFSVATPGSIAIQGFVATPGPPSNPPPTTKPLTAGFLADHPILMSDSASLASTQSSTSNYSITIRSFGAPRAVTNPNSKIPAPKRGTSRSFKSRHGYFIPESGRLSTEPSSPLSRGLGISSNLYENHRFADEVNAELNRRNGIRLPIRKDSLPSAAKSPSTVDELNELNAMDPAFTRAVEGLRMASEEKGEVSDQRGEEGKSIEATEPNKKGRRKDRGKKKKTSRKHWF